MNNGDNLLEVINLVKRFPAPGGGRGKDRWIRAVDGTDFTIARGETLGLVGESGSGKSTVGRCIVRLTIPDSGDVIFDGIDVFALSAGDLRQMRRRIQIVFQDPLGSLNPRMRVGAAVKEPIRAHRLAPKEELDSRVAELFSEVGLDGDLTQRYPHELSGGQRQRVVIARALSVAPEFVVLDEPVSALDVSVQGQVLNLLSELRARHNLTYLFIAHDLSVVFHTCDRVAVMYLGKVVELSQTAQLFDSPLHPYTAALLSAVPIPDPKRGRERIVLRGEIPSARTPPRGCAFYARCPHTSKDDTCRRSTPELREVRPGRWAACHYAEDPIPLNL